MRDTTKLAPFQNQSESFTAFRDDHSYYVDKTDVITYLIESGHKICVCTRPRRFGKTLMLRTLQTFFEYRLAPMTIASQGVPPCKQNILT